MDHKKKKIGIFGGTFDPIHSGHLILAEYIRSDMELSKIIFVPCKVPPHKPGICISDGDHRLNMVRLAIEDNPDFEVSDIEMHQDGPSYTALTLTRMKAQGGYDAELYFIMGADSAFAIEGWYQAESMLSEFYFIAGSRPGYQEQELFEQVSRLNGKYPGHVICSPIPMMDISSTDIKQRVKEGKSITYLVHPAVKGYILENGLYK